MGLSYGFYNSLAGDRKYNAKHMSHIFDGIILDGVYMTIGTRFFVKATTGMGITVGVGRAWFNHTWTYNDSELPLNVPNSDLLLDRIDALVLEVDARDESRINSIKWVKGLPNPIPEKPTLIHEEYLNQYPLAYITVVRGTTIINQADIENMVGTEEVPYVTAPLETIDASELLAKWDNEWSILLTEMKFQKEQQASDFLIFQENMQETYDSIKQLYQALETQSFTLINHNFDDWSSKLGCDYKHEFVKNGLGKITEVKSAIIVSALNFLLATRTVINTYEAGRLIGVLTTVTFNPFEIQDGANTIKTLGVTMSNMVDMTHYKTDGYIMEVIR